MLKLSKHDNTFMILQSMREFEVAFEYSAKR